ncbi:hypothetical protein GGI07_000233 [Coemansia sp. Benny D115]|nr:hypothetical protein GGI07_000233 [Coemansia sp. Benny D115]
MHSGSSSSSRSSSPSRLGHKNKNPVGGANTTTSKPKQVVDDLVDKVKSTFSKEKTEEKNYKSGQTPNLPGRNRNDNDVLRTDNQAYNQKNAGATSGAAGIAGAAAGGYKGAAESHRHGDQYNQYGNNNVPGNERSALHDNNRHGGAAANVASSAAAPLGAAEGAIKRNVDKATGHHHTGAVPEHQRQHQQYELGEQRHNPQSNLNNPRAEVTNPMGNVNPQNVNNQPIGGAAQPGYGQQQHQNPLGNNNPVRNNNLGATAGGLDAEKY